MTDLVLSAFDQGYRAVDTAAFYQTEDTAGLAIAGSGIARENIYITTKWDGLHGQDVRAEVDASLAKLGVAYVDRAYRPLRALPRDRCPRATKALTSLCRLPQST